jgi:hypothetical protein
MGSRDYRHRENKKSKKDPKAVVMPRVAKPPLDVEVVHKGKREEQP